MLTLTLHLDRDTFHLSGDLTLVEALPVLTTWYAQRTQPDLNRDRLREMTARLTESTDTLSEAERADAGT